VERPPSSSSALLYASVPCAPPRSAPVAVALLPQLATASAHVRLRSSPSYAQHRAIGRPALQEASVRYIHHRGVTSTSNLQPFPSPAATTVTSASTLRCSPTIPLAASTASPRHHHCSPPLGLCRRGQPDSGEHCLFRPRNPAPPLWLACSPATPPPTTCRWSAGFYRQAVDADGGEYLPCFCLGPKARDGQGPLRSDGTSHCRSSPSAQCRFVISLRIIHFKFKFSLNL
jgi:hypothetical protein